MLICLGIFVLVFLLWPTTTQTVPCGPNANCEVEGKVGIGGGAKAIYSLVSGKDTVKEANSNLTAALLGSAVIAGFVYVMARTYKKKNKKLRRKNT